MSAAALPARLHREKTAAETAAAQLELKLDIDRIVEQLLNTISWRS
ncbi:MAG: hypothetical protein MO853_12045 [Candidatus Protistobacter heckmanni]|nr:hypothetical protein [Candidatus Protistobacter heckmanni]